MLLAKEEYGSSKIRNEPCIFSSFAPIFREEPAKISFFDKNYKNCHKYVLFFDGNKV